jgi:hypothetical protein
LTGTINRGQKRRKMDVDDQVYQSLRRFLRDIQTSSITETNQFGVVESTPVNDYYLPITYGDSEIMASNPSDSLGSTALGIYKETRRWLLRGAGPNATIQMHDVLLFPMIASLPKMANIIEQLGLFNDDGSLPSVATRENSRVMVDWVLATFAAKSYSNYDYLSLVMQSIVRPAFGEGNVPTVYATSDISKIQICIPVYELDYTNVSNLRDYNPTFYLRSVTQMCFQEYSANTVDAIFLLTRLGFVTDPMIMLRDLEGPGYDRTLDDDYYKHAVVAGLYDSKGAVVVSGIYDDYGAFVVSMMGLEILRNRPLDKDMMTLMSEIYRGDVGPVYTSETSDGGRTTGPVIADIVVSVDLSDADRDFVLTRMLYFAVIDKSTLTMLNGIAPNDPPQQLLYVTGAVELWMRLRKAKSTFASVDWGIDLLLFAIHRDSEGPVTVQRLDKDGKKYPVSVRDAYMGAIFDALPTGRLPPEWVTYAVIAANQIDTQTSILVLSTLKKYGAIDTSKALRVDKDKPHGLYLSELAAQANRSDETRIGHALAMGAPFPRREVASAWENSAKTRMSIFLASAGEAVGQLFEPTPEEQARRLEAQQEQQRRRMLFMQRLQRR